MKFNATEPIARLAEAKVLLELVVSFNDPPLSKRKKQRARTLLDKVAVESETQSHSKQS